MDAARARCEAGVEGDVFCPYIRFWPQGGTVVRPEGCGQLRVAVALAPGGYASFGDEGLANLSMPILLMGGTIDQYTQADLEPIFRAAPAPKVMVRIDRMGHMGFTDICRLPIVALIPTLSEMCDPEVHIDVDRGWQIIRPFTVAFLRRHLKDEQAMDAYLEAGYATGFPEVSFDAQ